MLGSIDGPASPAHPQVARERRARCRCATRALPARLGRHARPDLLRRLRAPRPRGTVGAAAARVRADPGSGHRWVLPRKEVIQPQLPLRLPCSRCSPCRHEAWTISSSSLPSAKSGLKQTALPRNLHRALHHADMPEHQKRWSRGARRVVSEGSTKTPGWTSLRLPC